MTLAKDSYLDKLRLDVDAMARAARSADFDASVPSCPGWGMADLIAHTAEVHHNWTEVAARGITHEEELSSRPKFERPSNEHLLDTFESGGHRLVATLATKDPDEPAWNWSSTQPQTIAFIPRRMAHETSVHRWDAQSAIGPSDPIDAELAADGVDEFLYVHLPEDDGSPREEETVHIHRTDGPGEWLVTMGPDGVVVTDEHAKADVAVRGPASDLVLMLWRRIPPSRLEVLGDEAVLERFLAVTDLT